MLRFSYTKAAGPTAYLELDEATTLADVNAAVDRHREAVLQSLASRHAAHMTETLTDLGQAHEEIRQLNQKLIQAQIDYKKLGKKYRRDTGETSRFWYAMAHMADFQNPGYDDSLELDEAEVDEIYNDDEYPELKTDEMKEWERRQSWGEWSRQFLGLNGVDRFGTVFRFSPFQDKPTRVDWFMNVRPATEPDEYPWPPLET